MVRPHCERLSAMDASFLALEDANTHMHGGSVTLLEAGPLAGPDGGLDFARIVELVRAQLHKTPRFRQKLAWVPGFDQPVWIDDEDFDLGYHLRHTALPRPGDERQLKRLAGRLLSQPLDRAKPLWELWFVEGVEDGRLAVITKLHHCMADGIAGVGALNLIMGPAPDYRPGPAPPWQPRPAPTATRLFVDELRREITRPLERPAAGQASAAWKTAASLPRSLGAVLETAASALARPTVTPLNVELGPHRRIDWTRFDLEEVKELRTRAGGKLNDVVLAVVAGAMRRFLRERGVPVDDLAFRVAVPVNLRPDGERGAMGNRASSLVVTLPLDEADPWKRLLRVVETTSRLKRSGQAAGIGVLEQLAERAPARLRTSFMKLAAGSAFANMVVTNVPGPTAPVYMLGARLLASYVLVPLLPRNALGIALFSADGGLFWGLNADRDAVDGLHDLAEELQLQLEALRKAALAAPGSARSRVPG